MQSKPRPQRQGQEGKGKSKGKGKGEQPKGKNTAPAPKQPQSSQTRTSSLTPEQKKQKPCFMFYEGRCPKSAADCEWGHRQPTEDELKTYKRIRGRSPSPAAKPRPCATFAKTKSCPLGNNCAYSHDSSPPKPKGAKAKSK